MREYLKELRCEKGLTQFEIAKELDVSESYYNLIENNERQKNMSIKFAKKLASALSVSPEVIIESELAKESG